MKTYFLFSDNAGTWHREITATSWKAAIKLARDQFSIKGKLRLSEHTGDRKTYKLDNSSYFFDLRIVY
jgi:uncharacterized protein YdeI (BOF family)